MVNGLDPYRFHVFVFFLFVCKLRTVDLKEKKVWLLLPKERIVLVLLYLSSCLMKLQIKFVSSHVLCFSCL